MAKYTPRWVRKWESPANFRKEPDMPTTTHLRDAFEHPEDYLILDTETTGLKDPSTRIIELSIIDFNGKVLFTSLFDPQISLPEKIVEITGLKDEDLTGQPLFASKIDEILSIINGRTVMAWNEDFDHCMLNFELQRAERLPEMRAAWECAMLTYCVETRKGKRFFKLAKAMEEQGSQHSQEHRSLGDCMDTLYVLKAVKEGAEYDLFASASMTAASTVNTAVVKEEQQEEPERIVVDDFDISDEELEP